MKNKKFREETSDQKREKLVKVIKRRTNNTLSQNEISEIIGKISIETQHVILVHEDVKSFDKALILRHSDKRLDRAVSIFGSFVFGHSYNGRQVMGVLHYHHEKNAAAVIFRDCGEIRQNELHIYIPNMKGKV